MTEVIMPKMGDGMEEGTLVEWLKKEGDEVKAGETIANIQTDKATLEMESPAAGVFGGVLLQAGQTVPVGTPIAAVLAKGESLTKGWGSRSSASAPVTQAVVAPAAVVAEATVGTSASAPVGTNGSRVKASPLAKKIAAEAGLDLAAVAGSGPGGRIVEKDVRAALESKPRTSTAAPARGDLKVPLTNLRRLTAQRTHQSMQEAPHFYVTVEVDLEKVMALREFFKEEESGPVSVNDFVMLATARALRTMPEVNASFGGDHVLQHGAVNVGMAVAVDEGLTVAVMRNADQMTLRQVAASSRDLAARAKENRLTLDELSGSTVSISNMGMLDVDVFAAIINVPNAAILAVATAKRVPVVVNEEDEIEVRWRMNVTGSFDHRVVDGVVGANFMNAVRRFLENPTHLVT